MTPNLTWRTTLNKLIILLAIIVAAMGAMIGVQEASAWMVISSGSTVANEGGGGTVSFVGAVEGDITSGGTTATCTPHGSTSEGDYMVATVMSDTADLEITWPSGWSATTASVTESSSTLYAAVKTAGSDESGAYTFTLGSSADFEVAIATFSKTGGTWAVGDSSATGQTGSATMTSGAIDIASGGMAYIIYGSDDASVATTPPATMSEAVSMYDTISTRLYSYYEAFESGGSAVTRDMVWSVTTHNYTVIALSIEAQ
jgi:hypothetical protein